MEQNLNILPQVLVDLVLDFAYSLSTDTIKADLETILMIKRWKLPFWFTEEKVWSWKYRKYLPSPLNVYTPIIYFGGTYQELFNIDTVWSFLEGLDFRIKEVRAFGSRRLWQSRLTHSWRTYDALSSFYKYLLKTNMRVLKEKSPYKEYYVIGKPNRL